MGKLIWQVGKWIWQIRFFFGRLENYFARLKYIFIAGGKVVLAAGNFFLQNINQPDKPIPSERAERAISWLIEREDFFLLDWSPPDESFNKETWDSIRNSCNVWPSVLNFFSFDLSPAFLGCPITRASLDIWFEALLSRPLSATQTLTRFCLHIAPYCGQDQG